MFQSILAELERSVATDRLDIVVWHYVVLVICSLSLWTLCYLLLCRFHKKRKLDWHCRIITMVHGVWLVIMAIWILSDDWKLPHVHDNQARASTQLIQITACLSVGYFIFDLIWCLKHDSEDPVMIAHHICTIFFYCLAITFGKWGNELVTVAIITETTNPILQIRWFLRETGRGRSIASVIVDWLFISIFTINRIGYGTVIIVSYCSNPRTDIIGRTGWITIYVISWLFWIKIVSFGWGKYISKWLAKRRE